MDWLKNIAFAGLRMGARLPGRAYLERFAWLAVLRDMLHRLQIDCILDVGANKGQFGRDLRRIGYTGWIVSFEPNPSDYNMLLQNADSKWLSQQIALGQEDGCRPFNLAVPELSVLNSFLKPVYGSPDKTIVVETRRLDGLLDEILVTTGAKKLFLKLDTQGFDVEVVKGAAGRIREFHGLLSEVSVAPIYVGMPHYLDALRLYESLGFIPHSFHVVSRNSDDSIIEYDALLFRSNSLEDVFLSVPIREI